MSRTTRPLLLVAAGFVLLPWGLAQGQPSPAAGKEPEKNPAAAAAAPSGASAAAPAADATPPSKPGDEAFTLENSLNLRDPFRRPVPKATLGADGLVPPLERYELEKYKLVGVITGPRKNKALVTDPDGKLHVVSENMYIGTRHGKINRIGPGQITIEEKVVNLLGQEEKVESFIEFQKDEKDKDKDGKQ